MQYGKPSYAVQPQKRKSGERGSPIGQRQWRSPALVTAMPSLRLRLSSAEKLSRDGLTVLGSATGGICRIIARFLLVRTMGEMTSGGIPARPSSSRLIGDGREESLR